jgi:DNA-directed RNA polymerase specialized sigma24 family protein
VADAFPLKKKWSLTQEAFDKLLASLDADRERAGEKYEQIRAGLVKLFQWRGCPFPEDHADETINRVARKLADGEEFRDIYTYIQGVARMVVLEALKASAKEQAISENQPNQTLAEEDDDSQLRIECLKLCLEKLPLESREMIMNYYQGEKREKIEGRQKLAGSMSLSPNVLRNRAYRLRDKLQTCVDACMKKQKKT